ncbi:hypothetical protein IWZ03DRAFT_240546 [Phyllosticta citriasiana]|uniref:Uncharacterized protein n=1 Tax=Phyllosticta citriasiana TaxID=595635 RepID=A0ABR1KFD5_9PEZI
MPAPAAGGGVDAENIVSFSHKQASKQASNNPQRSLAPACHTNMNDPWASLPAPSTHHRGRPTTVVASPTADGTAVAFLLACCCRCNRSCPGCRPHARRTEPTAPRRSSLVGVPPHPPHAQGEMEPTVQLQHTAARGSPFAIPICCVSSPFVDAEVSRLPAARLGFAHGRLGAMDHVSRTYLDCGLGVVQRPSAYVMLPLSVFDTPFCGTATVHSFPLCSRRQSLFV